MSCEHKSVTIKIGQQNICDECHQVTLSDGALADEVNRLRELLKETVKSEELYLEMLKGGQK